MKEENKSTKTKATAMRNDEGKKQSQSKSTTTKSAQEKSHKTGTQTHKMGK